MYFQEVSWCGVEMLKSKIFTANEVVFCEDKTVSWHVWELVKKEMTKGKKVKSSDKNRKGEKRGSPQ